MNIDYIKLFVRIAARSNISVAGKELGLSAAVSSAHMAKLESDLGVRLIHRTTRRVSLTEDGEAFLPHAVELLESVESARASVGSGEQQPQGRLRVAASASFGRMHLVPALTDFLRRFPKISVDIHLSDNVVDMVEGGFDIAIRDSALNNSTLVARKLAPVKRILCASPEYLERYGEPMSPSDLVKHKCVSLMGLDTWQLQTPSGPLSVKPDCSVRTDNGEAARDAATYGLGITLCSTWCCYRQIKRGELLEVMRAFPPIEKTAIWAVYPSSRLLAPKVRVFIDYLAECFANPYWDA